MGGCRLSGPGRATPLLAKASFRVVGSWLDEWPREDNRKARVKSQAAAKGMSKKEVWTKYLMACEL